MVMEYFKSTRLVALCLYLVTRELILRTANTGKRISKITLRNERSYVMWNMRTAVCCV